MSQAPPDPLGVELLKQVDFGFEVKQFLGSRIGRSLIARAEEDVAAAVETLKTVDPTDAKEITRLQMVIYRAESIQYWLAEIIQAGEHAQATLEQD